MSLVVLVSAKGAPGVTTLTVALAALTPGAVAADLDPDGGDLALRYRRPDGAPLDAELGLLSLVAGLRRDQPGHRWLPATATGADGVSLPEGPTRLENHLQVTGGGLDLLLGVNGPEQATGLGPLWSPLARALSEAGRTVFADCGRVGPASPTMPVLHQADAVIVVARPELEELAHLRERLRFLNSAVPGRFAGRAQIGVVLVAPERDRAVAGRTEQLLHSSGVGVPVLGTVALDQRGAEALRGMNRSRLTRSTLIRSVRSLLPSVSLLAGSIPELSGPVEAPRPSRFTAPAPPLGQKAPAPAAEPPFAPEPEVDLFAEPRGKVTAPPTIPPVPIPATVPPAAIDVAGPPRPQIVELPAAGPRPAPELRPGSRLEVPTESRAESRAETTSEQTLPLRRQNSFFGDAPPVEQDPNLLPLTVAPGVFTPAPSERPEPERQSAETTGTSGPVRGFAGLTTPPEPVTHPDNDTQDELRHTRSRRAAFGRDPGALQTSERRRARRHVMPSEENEKAYGRADYGNQAGEGTPAVGTWLQERSVDADPLGPSEDKLPQAPPTPTPPGKAATPNDDALGWGWAKDQGESPQPRATRSVVEPASAEEELPPLPRRDRSLAETRGFPEPEAERRDLGTGWIPPDVPPSELPLLPSSVPTSMPTSGPVSVPTVVPASLVTSDVSSPNEASQPVAVPSLPVDPTDILREIRDRARLGTDGSGTWAGHLRSAGTPPETSAETPEPTAPAPESTHEPDDDHDDDHDTAVVRLIRDPYEPPERYEGAADSPEPPEGGR